MPIYEYECQSCASRFELRQGFNDEPVKFCPTCRGEARRVIHSVPIVFKGSGFYVNDYRKGGARDYDGDKTEPKAEAKPDGKTESKVEAKTEKKAESKTGDRSTSQAPA